MKYLAKITIRKQLTVLILVFMFSMASIVMIILKNIIDITEERTRRFSQDIINQMEININKYINDNYQIAKSIAYNKAVQEFLLSEDMSEVLDKEKQIRSFMENSRTLKDNIEGITILFKDSHISYGAFGNIDELADFDINNTKKPFYTHLFRKGYNSYYYYIMPFMIRKWAGSPWKESGHR